VLGAPPMALATLGGDATSIDADRARVQAVAGAISQSAGYSVRQLTLPTGTVVREYLSEAGKVFAVSWQGRAAPDLRVLLGDYFASYAAGAGGRHSRHHLAIEQPDLVVHAGGHMRALTGRAYVPSLLPPGFSVDHIE